MTSRIPYRVNVTGLTVLTVLGIAEREPTICPTKRWFGISQGISVNGLKRSWAITTTLQLQKISISLRWVEAMQMPILSLPLTTPAVWLSLWVAGPFDETRKVLKNLFGPSRDYTDLDSHPENYETFSINSTQPGDDNDRDSGSYYGNFGLAQFENITVGNHYTICRGGDFKSAAFTPSGVNSPTNGVVAGVFSVRMIANPNENHAFRCVYRPLKRSPALDTDRDPDG